MKKERIRAIFRKPLTNKSEIVEVENTVEGIQEMIGGYFECVTIEEGICLLCDEDGKLKRLQPNCIYRGDIIAGPILIVGTQGDEFTSIPELFAERFMKKREDQVGGKSMGKLLPKGKLFAIGPDGELLDVAEITPDQTETLSGEEIDDEIAYLALNSSETMTMELDPESSSVIRDLVDDIEEAWAELIALPATKMQ